LDFSKQSVSDPRALGIRIAPRIYEFDSSGRRVNLLSHRFDKVGWDVDMQVSPRPSYDPARALSSLDQLEPARTSFLRKDLNSIDPQFREAALQRECHDMMQRVRLDPDHSLIKPIVRPYRSAELEVA
jgi:hypothetical protein